MVDLISYDVRSLFMADGDAEMGGVGIVGSPTPDANGRYDTTWDRSNLPMNPSYETSLTQDSDTFNDVAFPVHLKRTNEITVDIRRAMREDYYGVVDLSERLADPIRKLVTQLEAKGRIDTNGSGVTLAFLGRKPGEPNPTGMWGLSSLITEKLYQGNGGTRFYVDQILPGQPPTAEDWSGQTAVLVLDHFDSDRQNAREAIEQLKAAGCETVGVFALTGSLDAVGDEFIQVNEAEEATESVPVGIVYDVTNSVVSPISEWPDDRMRPDPEKYAGRHGFVRFRYEPNTRLQDWVRPEEDYDKE